MKLLTLEIPDTVKLDQIETTRFLASKLYEVGKLTLAQAAKVSNLSVQAFAEILSDYDVSLINYDYSEAINDAEKF